jgi:hypothetical protein
MGGPSSYEVFGETYCGYSKDAAKLAAVPLRPVSEMDAPHQEASQDHSTIPKVFFGGEFIGGKDELVAHMAGARKPDKCVRRKKECHNSCFDTEELHLIAKQYNATHKGETPIAVSGGREALYAELRERIGACNKDSEKCWINQSFAAPLRARLLKAFSPKMPDVWRKKPNTWLTDGDINSVMELYAAHHPNFHYMGVQFMDFRGKKADGGCVSDLCDFRVDGVFPKYGWAAAIFNLDKHTQRGSHWVALMMCLKPGNRRYGIYYYDSVARPPTPEMDEFITDVTRQQVDKGLPAPRYMFNNVRHQKKNSECGMFCLYMVERMLNTRLAFSSVCKLMGDDDNMLRFRTEFFQP